MPRRNEAKEIDCVLPPEPHEHPASKVRTVRRKIIIELAIIAALTTIFLLLFPIRNPLVDVALAGFALLCIALTAGYTKNVIWGASPSPVTENRLRRGLVFTFWITIPPALIFLIIGGLVAHKSGGWAAVRDRCFNWGMLGAFGCYLPWALMQQALLQFYLLGRLLVLFPQRLRWVALFVTGLCFGLVHYPDALTASVVVVSGTLWSFIYYRYRTLLPLALSHATLGTTFYYGICGQNLAAMWRSALP